MPTGREAGAGVTVSSGPLAATFLPELGMLGISLRHRGEELLALPGGLDGYRAGNVTGLPLLAPWANRLGANRYEVDDHALGPPGEITRAIQSGFSEAIQGKRQEYLEWLDFVELESPKGIEEPVA